MPSPDTTAVSGPWVAETGVTHCEPDHGLAVIAVLPDMTRVPDATPTRGMVAWVHSGMGACETDDKAIATARLIAAAPDLLALLVESQESIGGDWRARRDALIAQVKGTPHA